MERRFVKNPEVCDYAKNNWLVENLRCFCFIIKIVFIQYHWISKALNLIKNEVFSNFGTKIPQNRYYC